MPIDPQSALWTAILTHDETAFVDALARGARLDRACGPETHDDALLAGEQMVAAAITHGSARLLKITEAEHDLRPYVKQMARGEFLGHDLHKHRSSKVLDCLIRHWPADHDWRVGYGEDQTTWLHTWSRLGNLPLVSCLIEYGMPVDARNARGQTALHLASHSLVQLALLDAGADARAVDHRGHTPLWERIHQLRLRSQRKAGASAIQPHHLLPIIELVKQEGLRQDPKAQVLARRLRALYDGGLGERVETKSRFEPVWRQMETIEAEARAKRLKRIATQGRRVAEKPRGPLGW